MAERENTFECSCTFHLWENKEVSCLIREHLQPLLPASSVMEPGHWNLKSGSQLLSTHQGILVAIYSVWTKKKKKERKCGLYIAFFYYNRDNSLLCLLFHHNLTFTPMPPSAQGSHFHLHPQKIHQEDPHLPVFVR